MATRTPRLDSIEAMKNLAINGGFNFWQRGTTGSGQVIYLADRFQCDRSPAIGVTWARSTDVPTFDQAGAMLPFSLQGTITTAVPSLASGDYMCVTHKLEGLDYATLHRRKFRLQFWIKSSITGTYCLNIRNSTFTPRRYYNTTFTINAANTWEVKYIDITADNQDAAWIFDNTVALLIRITLASASNLFATTLNDWHNAAGDTLGVSGQSNFAATVGNVVRVAGFMLVPGTFDPTSPLPFVRTGKSIADELSLCQRYYEKSYDLANAPQSNVQVTKDYATAADRDGAATITVPFKVQKRIAPTVAVYRGDGTTGLGKQVGSAVAVNDNATIDSKSETAFRIWPTTASAAGSVQHVFFHWTADAEL